MVLAVRGGGGLVAGGLGKVEGLNQSTIVEKCINRLFFFVVGKAHELGEPGRPCDFSLVDGYFDITAVDDGEREVGCLAGGTFEDTDLYYTGQFVRRGHVERYCGVCFDCL